MKDDGNKYNKKIIAELLGTFTLVLLGCGAAVIAGGDTAGGLSGLGLLGIAFAFGMAQLMMCYAIGGISGSHINPAVTIAMLVAGKMKSSDAGAYIVAQLVGAVLGAYVLMTIMNGMPGFSMEEWALGSNGWGVGYQNEFNTTSAFVTELVMTFLFLFTILGVTSKWGNSTMAGVTIGFALFAIHLFTIPVTGTSVNPARSFGPALLSGGTALSQLWLFVVAPIIGGILAAVLWKVLGVNQK
ncbi:MAG: MIP family channel protein [Chitinophagales bacterium]|nr:MIP family channel protein [Chitinophagales bacterium]